METKVKRNTELIEKWVEALRSEDYEQGEGALKKIVEDDRYGLESQEYCCLGVLCDISRLGEWRRADIHDDMVLYHCPDPYMDSQHINLDGSLNSYMLEAAGLTQHEQTQLINMNDSGDYDFNDIANWIEKFILEKE